MRRVKKVNRRTSSPPLLQNKPLLKMAYFHFNFYQSTTLPLRISIPIFPLAATNLDDFSLTRYRPSYA